jgi:predicted RNA-binding Zn ribbon-like protein
MESAAGPVPPCRYIAGDLALDFINTADWTLQGPVRDRLAGCEQLIRWAEGAQLLRYHEGERLRSAARRRPDRARAVVRRAHTLRLLLHQLFRVFATGRETGPEVARLLPALRQAQLHRILVRRGKRHVWVWEDWAEDPGCLLWPVAWAAGEILTSEEAGLIRICGGEDCGWLFVDRSRSGRRRWCQMETCGTRAKNRRRARRASTRRVRT